MEVNYGNKIDSKKKIEKQSIPIYKKNCCLNNDGYFLLK